MDKKPAVGHRIHFKKTVPSAYPVLLVGRGVKEAVVFVNEGTQAIRLGFSGTVSTNGLYLDGGKSFADNYSLDEYWGQATSSSGTVSGIEVV